MFKMEEIIVAEFAEALRSSADLRLSELRMTAYLAFTQNYKPTRKTLPLACSKSECTLKG